MTKLFISYRRADSQLVADRIHDHMVTHFGEGNVFQDVDTIPLGVDFRDYLRDAVNQTDAVLVVIGPDWARIMRERQLEDSDLVRIEVESALRLNKLVIPVLAMGANMPTSTQVPESIRDLCWRNAARVRPNPDFRRDCAVIAENVTSVLAKTASFLSPASTPDSPVGTRHASSALERARAFTGQRNRDWQPYVTTFSNLKIPDMSFCLVPVGTFNMGSDDGRYDDESPVHSQTITQPYWIGQYPVTNAQWRLAADEGGVPEPEGVGNALKWYRDKEMADAPVVGVTWFMARDFVNWIGARLLTEMEWEYAARGVESLRYPWGNDWNPNVPIWDKNSGGKPANVTTKPEGKSWVDARHMIGNVWEWSASLYEPYPYLSNSTRERDTGDSTDALHVLRGGSWGGSDSGVLRAACRNGGLPDFRYYFWGFRLALSH